MGDIIVNFLDPNTGELVYTADESGVIRYSITRLGNPFITFAELIITVLDDDDDDDDDDSDDDDSDEDSDDDSDEDSDDDSDEAVLPDTGAATGLQLIGGSGLVMLLGGFGLIGTTRRRAVGATLRH